MVKLKNISISTLAVIFLMLVSAQLAYATSLNSWDVDITLNEDRSADWRVILNYKESVQRDDYWILGDVRDASVTVDGTTVKCSVIKPELGTSIICDNINGSLIVYSIHVTNAVGLQGNFYQFRYTFPVTRLTDRFASKVALPLGSALVDTSKLAGTGFSPFEPAFGKQGSDGRRIFVTWELQNPKLGETINAAAIYEPLSQKSEIPIIPIVLIVAIMAAALTYLFYFRRQPERLLPALMPNERSIMELVIKQRSIDQRDVVRSTGFSKAKVSRIVQTLVDRRLVEAVPKGRTRELKLMQQSNVKDSIWSKFFRIKVKQSVDKLDLNRAQALEIVQMALTPMIDWLDTVLERLHRHKYGYAWNGSRFIVDERFTNPVKDVMLKEVSKMLPSANTRLETYNEGIERISGILKRIEQNVISNKDFATACMKLTKSKYPYLEKEIIHNLVRHVIDKDPVARSEYAWSQLWNANASQLSRSAETRQVKTLRLELLKSAQLLTRTCTTVRKELEQVREHIRREHHMLFRELRA